MLRGSQSCRYDPGRREVQENVTAHEQESLKRSLVTCVEMNDRCDPAIRREHGHVVRVDPRLRYQRAAIGRLVRLRYHFHDFTQQEEEHEAFGTQLEDSSRHEQQGP